MKANWNKWMACQDCFGDGWGPMLTRELWASIKPNPFPTQPDCRIFLCESCMEGRLGRKLRPGDLSDCPMNHKHKCYLPNRAEGWW